MSSGSSEVIFWQYRNFYVLKKNLVTIMDIKIDLKTCESDKDIFYVFEKALKFPDWWGKNWDAFYDCLCDSDFNNMGKESKLVIMNSKHIIASVAKKLREILEAAVTFHNQHKTMAFSYEILK
jgi:RNAse (barnase) inhibitor barstar